MWGIRTLNVVAVATVIMDERGFDFGPGSGLPRVFHNGRCLSRNGLGIRRGCRPVLDGLRVDGLFGGFLPERGFDFRLRGFAGIVKRRRVGLRLLTHAGDGDLFGLGFRCLDFTALRLLLAAAAQLRPGRFVAGLLRVGMDALGRGLRMRGRVGYVAGFPFRPVGPDSGTSVGFSFAMMAVNRRGSSMRRFQLAGHVAPIRNGICARDVLQQYNGRILGDLPCPAHAWEVHG